MIKLEHVSKKNQMGDNSTLFALRDINMRVQSGDFIAIMGPSGSGKSTLMHIMGLLDKPSSGDVYIENKNIAKISDDALSRLRALFVGFVFQQFHLINKHTVVENVMLPTIYNRNSLSYVPRVRALHLLSQLGLSDKADTYPNRLSGGQQQRVAIARALMMEPKLILADEPTGNLDSRTGKEILDLLSNLNKKDKITVALVTHDPLVARRAQHIYHIKDGKIVKK